MNMLCSENRAKRFSLSGSAPENFAPCPPSAVLWLEYEGRVPEKAIAKNAVVYPGMVIAKHPDPGMGDLHCPVVGVVSEASAQGVQITVGQPKAGEDGKAPEIPVTRPVDLKALNGEALTRALKELGINAGALACSCKTGIINALNPDPGILWAEPMLTAHTDALKAGVALLKRLSGAAKYVLAIGQGASARLDGLDVQTVSPVYPFSLNPLVVKAVTGEECPADACAVGLHEIWKLGRVALTGLPVTETVLTLNGINYLVPLGTPAQDLLKHAGITLEDGDAVIFNGPLRGVAQNKPQAGVTSGTYGICVVRKDDVPPLEGDAACVACGECVRICPARIQPDLISRYAELGNDDQCRANHIDACMDCGLCTYACMARRPVLQHLRLARRRMSA
jgi:electron transport complex protein RnfC